MLKLIGILFLFYVGRLALPNVFFSLALGLFLLQRFACMSTISFLSAVVLSVFMDGGVIAVPLILLFYVLLFRCGVPNRFDFRVRLNKYVFYAFYPLHLFFLWVVKWLLLRAPVL
jgi:hypothetical protein